MSLYLPPLHINPVFNGADYNFQNGYLSYGYAESRYIRKVGSDTVGAAITFTNSLTVSGSLNISGSVSGLTKNMVGLGNCDNTSDANKPISTAVQTALSGLMTRTTTLEGITTNI